MNMIFPKRQLSDEQTKLVMFQIEEIETFMKVEDYQLDFFEDIQRQFYERGWLSDKQLESLKRIYERVTT